MMSLKVYYGVGVIDLGIQYATFSSRQRNRMRVLSSTATIVVRQVCEGDGYDSLI